MNGWHPGFWLLGKNIRADVVRTMTVLGTTEAYVEIAERIESWILSGKLQAGEKLPPERELCRQLGVSRPVIRESLHILHERGLIARSMKKGNFVSGVNWEPIRRSFVLYAQRAVVSVQEVLELRLFIEVPTARLAAERRTASDLKYLRKLLQEMESNLPSVKDALLQGPEHNRYAALLEEHVASDMKFHMGIARAARNILVEPVLDSLTELIRRYMYLDLRQSDGHVVATDFHGRLLECIENRDPEGAGAVMYEHLSHFSGGGTDVVLPLP